MGQDKAESCDHRGDKKIFNPEYIIVDQNQKKDE